VTEDGSEAEGGVLRKQKWQAIYVRRYSANYRPRPPTTEEGGLTTKAIKAAPASGLLTRDQVARCIRREVKEGRASPHGGVFLDIAWSRKAPERCEHIRQKAAQHVPSVQAASPISDHQRTDGDRSDHAYMMGGVKVTGGAQMFRFPASLPPEKRVRACMERTGLGEIQLSDLLVFGQRAGEFAAKFAKEHGAGEVKQRSGGGNRSLGTGALERGAAGENPTPWQYELQEMMQDLVGIVRREDEMERALEGIQRLKARAARAGITGNREYNNGGTTALDLRNLLTVSEIVARAAVHAHRKAARALSRRLSGKERLLGGSESVRCQIPRRDGANSGKCRSSPCRTS